MTIIRKRSIMSENMPPRLTQVSLRDMEEVVMLGRTNEEFGSFEIFDPVTVSFEDESTHDVLFPRGSRIAHYGRGAVYLACLTSSYDLVRVKHDGTAEVQHHDLTEKVRFNTWMNSLWNLPYRPRD